MVGLGTSRYEGIGVGGLFFYENMFCDLVSQYSQQTPDDATCATVDAGCQRLAVGATTLTKFGDHLPPELRITIHPETNRFRSVHQSSFLKPAVFESDESTNAPFLLSLSFLLHCHGDVGLCLG